MITSSSFVTRQRPCDQEMKIGSDSLVLGIPVSLVGLCVEKWL